MRHAWWVAALAVFSIAAQDGKKGVPGAQAKGDPAKVDAAVKRGVEHLLQAHSPAAHQGIADSDELLLWTFLHAGVPEDHPRFQELLRKMLEGKLERTYEVALQAMVLEELDRAKHQRRIAQCAQFLIDNQPGKGHWGYGVPTTFVDDVPTAVPRKSVATGGGSKPKPKGSDPRLLVERRPKPKVVGTVTLTKRREGADQGDNSNSQYAALGLRACHDAGIILPAEGVKLAMKYWTDSQHLDPKSTARGWCYWCGSRDESAHRAWGSMTAGAVGSLVIYHYILNEPWMKDEAVLSGLEWLAKNFSVTNNPLRGDARDPGALRYYSYYLYALERVGILYGTERLGPHEWYPEGAKVLLDAQAGDGSWSFKSEVDTPVWDTCFAILFLRRATRPLTDVASVDRINPK
jgi:hypothetical protein